MFGSGSGSAHGFFDFKRMGARPRLATSPALKGAVMSTARSTNMRHCIAGISNPRDVTRRLRAKSKAKGARAACDKKKQKKNKKKHLKSTAQSLTIR